TDLLRQAHEDAEARRVDVAGVREVDEKPSLTGLELVEDLLLQFLAIPDDELTIDVNDDDAIRLRSMKAHESSATREYWKLGVCRGGNPYASDRPADGAS